MADGFDYLPQIRPHPDNWQFMCLQELRELRAAGGFRERTHTTRLETGPGTGGGGGAFNLQNSGEPSRDADDHYLRVKPGSFVWGVSVYMSLSVGNKDWLAISGAPWLEVELIDGQTNESWWRGSLDAGMLATQPCDDIQWFIARNPAVQLRQFQPMPGLFFWILGGREVLGDGLVMARLTGNTQPQSTGGFPTWPQTAPIGTGQAAQLSLHCMEPLTEGS